MAKVYKTTPVGRIVSGSRPIGALEISKDDRTGLPKKRKDDPNLNVEESYIGLAFAKTDPAWIAHKAELMAVDRQVHPSFFDAQGQRIPQMAFADKIIDGDGYNKKGKLHSEKEGYAGHEVLMLSTGFAPSLVIHNGTSWVETPMGSIKCGDYVMAFYSTDTNKSTESPGMYRNLDKIAFCWAGKEIVGGVDADTAFGAPPPAPPGAVTTPQAPALNTPPPAAPAAPVAAPPPAAPASPPPAAPPVAPYTGFMDPAAAAPAAPGAPPPPAPPAPAAPAGPVMTAAANGTTYEAYIGAGWTEQQIIDAGFMLPR